ncbi:NmrA family NAD(P)-binding protein [Novosphingobium taihuense]|uniref:Uncharacterized protein YbjT (DUF2867 family) n=1 Tax=Novosphingobium taihuense TaxID=260085 RepID=A0A7W7EUB4_9SPHN|nr:NmrA family NAD(P)-binding protein [Novosphingobium taihuense]MBB4614223.1 uncharacterized protein YbjT (DUF2867 family) [Novosphingobium taihuense]TWH87070.1 uncharacterized protein YbjT (DUF2867 family) [Novosphingobium taihuense]
MATDKIVLVTGATGMQGGAVVDALLDKGFKTRALVRDTNSAAARALAERGVETCQGSFDDVASLEAAMDGAYGVFSMQNVSLPDDPDSELRHGANLVDAARKTGVQVFVHTSVARAGRQSEFAGWSEGRWYEGYWNGKSGVNDIVRASGLPNWVIIKPAYMLENFLPPKVSFMYPGFGGKVIETAMSADARLDVVSATDVGRFAAAAFADPARFSGEEIDLAAAKVTMGEMAKFISDATGVSVSAHSFAPDDLVAKGYMPGLVDSQVWATVEGYQVDLDRAASFGVDLESPEAWAKRNSTRFQFDPN